MNDLEGCFVRNLMSSAQPIMAKTDTRQIGLALLVAYLVVYAAMLLAMHGAAAFDIAEPLMVLVILGVGFSLAAWLLTIGVQALDYSILKPKGELTAAAIYLLPVVLFATWGLDLLHRYVPADPGNAFTILAAKLLVFVVLPAAIMQARFGYRLRHLAPMSARIRDLVVMLGMSLLLLLFQAFLGRGPRDIASAHLPPSLLWYGIPLTFLWLALEAGVVEEFFFRVLLQTRLSAVLQSELGTIVLMSVIFRPRTCAGPVSPYRPHPRGTLSASFTPDGCRILDCDYLRCRFLPRCPLGAHPQLRFGRGGTCDG